MYKEGNVPEYFFDRWAPFSLSAFSTFSPSLWNHNFFPLFKILSFFVCISFFLSYFAYFLFLFFFFFLVLFFHSFVLLSFLVMSNQRFLKIVCFRFPTNVPKKIEYIRFWNKIHCRTKTFYFGFKIFGLNSNVFAFGKKKLEQIKKFWFCSKFFGKNRKVLLLEKRSWNTSKSFGFVPKFWNEIEIFHFRFLNTSKPFGFVSILSFDIETFVLSFRFVFESGSTLPDPDPLARGMDPDPDPNPSMRLLQKSESVCRGP